MTSDRILKVSVGLFVLAFFAYLFGPLIIIGLTAFNSSEFPRVSPWECFTVVWFDVLVNDTKLMDGLRTAGLLLNQEIYAEDYLESPTAALAGAGSS